MIDEFASFLANKVHERSANGKFTVALFFMNIFPPIQGNTGRLAPLQPEMANFLLEIRPGLCVMIRGQGAAIRLQYFNTAEVFSPRPGPKNALRKDRI